MRKHKLKQQQQKKKHLYFIKRTEFGQNLDMNLFHNYSTFIKQYYVIKNIPGGNFPVPKRIFFISSFFEEILVFQ